MFERKTVFVVGAGGSKELGLPMGSELTGKIAGKVHFTFPDGYNPKGGDGEIYYAIQQIVRERGQQSANPLYHAGQALARGMPQAISIDNYLHTHSHNEDVILLGKLGIAKTILESEGNSTIALNQNTNRGLAFGNIKESWHAVFCKMLLEGATRDDFEAIFDNVAFITFNYDRCIEHYLINALQNYLNIGQAEAEKMVNRLSIIHPYGQVGQLTTSRGGGTAFGYKVHHTELVEVAKQIRTFTERVEDDAVLTAIQHLISEAEVIVYLGYSYGDMNMELLSLKEAVEPRAVFGTSYGISGPNKKVIERDIINSMGPDADAVPFVELADITCVDFLYAYWKPILRGL